MVVRVWNVSAMHDSVCQIKKDLKKMLPLLTPDPTIYEYWTPRKSYSPYVLEFVGIHYEVFSNKIGFCLKYVPKR